MLRNFLSRRYPGSTSSTESVREFVYTTCQRFIELGFADSNYESNLCCGDEARFWQRFSEALIANELLEAGLDLRPSHEGPDFLVVSGNRKIWIEVICPEPTGIPSNWLETPSQTSVINFPHDSILLRWTAAIKEKAEKLYGNTKTQGYLKRGVVAPEDSYVIAINGRRLRGSFAAKNGISQFPFAAEAVFPIGPYQIQIDQDSFESTGSGHLYRPYILKANGSHVRALAFLDPTFSAVSAIWAMDMDESIVLGSLQKVALQAVPRS